MLGRVQNRQKEPRVVIFPSVVLHESSGLLYHFPANTQADQDKGTQQDTFFHHIFSFRLVELLFFLVILRRLRIRFRIYGWW
jgi:hypothetical protein